VIIFKGKYDFNHFLGSRAGRELRGLRELRELREVEGS
jgi:hypothetical protein